jgi:hypothetical protein
MPLKGALGFEMLLGGDVKSGDENPANVPGDASDFLQGTGLGDLGDHLLAVKTPGPGRLFKDGIHLKKAGPG